MDRDEVVLLMLRHFVEQWRTEATDPQVRVFAVGRASYRVALRLLDPQLTVDWSEARHMSHHASATSAYHVVLCLEEFQKLTFGMAQKLGLRLRGCLMPGGLLAVSAPAMRKASADDVDYYDFVKLEDVVGVQLKPVFEMPRGWLCGWWRE